MKCQNCSGDLQISVTENFLKCNHCGTYSVNNLLLNDRMNKNFGDEVNEFEILNLHEDYKTLKDISYDRIRANPKNWLAYFYYAISEYWLGKNDFKHIETVFSHFDKSFQLSNNEIVIENKDAFANCAVSLATNNKQYGEELSQSLDLFDFINNKGFELTKDIKEQQVKFCHNAIEQIISNIDKELIIKKMNFDITYINLKNLFRLSKFTKSLNHFEKFYLVSRFHLLKHRTKSYYKEIESNINEASIFLKSNNSNILNKSISFNFFGKLIIK